MPITITPTPPPNNIYINIATGENVIISGIAPTGQNIFISGGASVGSHNSLFGIQGGQGGEYYHLTSTEYANLVTGSVIRPEDTGIFYTIDNPSGFITGIPNIVYTTGNQLINGQKEFSENSIFDQNIRVSGNITGHTAYLNQVSFDVDYVGAAIQEGELRWNNTDGTLDLGMNGGDITMQVGQEMFTKVRNQSGSTITNGSVVYFDGRAGNRPLIGLAKADSDTTARVAGVATEDIASPADGFITTVGYVRSIKTNYTGTGIWGTTWNEGDLLYVSKSVAGQLTNIDPDAPHHSDIVGTVGIVHNSLGSILVTINRHHTLENLSDVNGTALTTDGQFPSWHQDSGYFDFDKNINDYLPLSGGNITGKLIASGQGEVSSLDNNDVITKGIADARYGNNIVATAAINSSTTTPSSDILTDLILPIGTYKLEAFYSLTTTAASGTTNVTANFNTQSGALQFSGESIIAPHQNYRYSFSIRERNNLATNMPITVGTPNFTWGCIQINGFVVVSSNAVMRFYFYHGTTPSAPTTGKFFVVATKIA